MGWTDTSIFAGRHSGQLRQAGRFLLLLFIVAATCTVAAYADPPPRQSAQVGDLTFRFAHTRWRTVATQPWLQLTCVEWGCRGLTFDIAVRASAEGECSKQSVYAEVMRLAPWADRTGVNIWRIGRYALAVADSWTGDASKKQTTVFGCMYWQDKNYRFTSRVWSNSGGWTASAWLRSLVAAMDAADPVITTAKVGVMTFSYPTDVWRGAATGPNSFHLGCQPPTCPDWGLTVSIIKTEGAGQCPRLGEDGYGGYGHHRELESVRSGDGKQTFSVDLYGTGCRNLTAPQLVGCTVHRGDAYLFSTPPPIGCTTGIDPPGDAFLNLLKSARFD